MSTMRSQDEIRNTVVSLGLPEHPYFMRRAARAMDLLDTGKVISELWFMKNTMDGYFATVAHITMTVNTSNLSSKRSKVN